VAGDVKPDEVFTKIEKYFGGISRRQVPPKPDVSEAPQTAERRSTQTDKFAEVPALAIGYRMPPRKSHDAVVAAVAGELLHNGQASLLYQDLVKGKQVALSVDGGANWPLGNPFEYDGPTLLTSFIVYSPKFKEIEVVSAYDAVIAGLAAKGPTSSEIDRIRTKMRSDWYGQLEIPVDRASVLAHATLFDGNPQRVNEIPDELAKVTPEEVRAFARQYVVNTNRTVIDRIPASGPGEKSEASEKGAQ
jgi:predicted Zn-dependent peptidase